MLNLKVNIVSRKMYIFFDHFEILTNYVDVISQSMTQDWGGIAKKEEGWIF